MKIGEGYPGISNAVASLKAITSHAHKKTSGSKPDFTFYLIHIFIILAQSFFEVASKFFKMLNGKVL